MPVKRWNWRSTVGRPAARRRSTALCKGTRDSGCAPARDTSARRTGDTATRVPRIHSSLAEGVWLYGAPLAAESFPWALILARFW